MTYETWKGKYQWGCFRALLHWYSLSYVCYPHRCRWRSQFIFVAPGINIPGTFLVLYPGHLQGKPLSALTGSTSSEETDHCVWLWGGRCFRTTFEGRRCNKESTYPVSKSIFYKHSPVQQSEQHIFTITLFKPHPLNQHRLSTNSTNRKLLK